MSALATALYLGPVALLYIGAGVVLMADLVQGRRAATGALTLVALGLAAVWALVQIGAGAQGPALGGAIVVDTFSLYFTFLLTAVTAAVVIATSEWAAQVEHRGEFYGLLLVSVGSMVLLVQSNDLITLFVALETTSLAQFILAGITRNARSSEAGLKYLLSGAVAAAVLLYGFAFLFGMAGTTSLPGIAEFVRNDAEAVRLPLIMAFVFVAAGIGFKMAVFPFHAWVPDVYQGAPTPVVSFLSVASKAAGFAVVLRLFYTGLGGGGTLITQDWAMLFAVLAAASMLFGNIGALVQTNVKRILGYSSIAQAGNIAIGVAAVTAGSTVGPSGVLFFLGTYAATNLGAFLAVNAVSARLGSDEISSYAGLLKRAPMAAVVLALCLASLTGLPPTAGFIAKVYVFNGAIQTGEWWLIALVAIAVVNTAISAFYYLRWVRTMILDEPEDDTRIEIAGGAQGVLLAAALAVLFFGVWPAPLILLAQQAAAALLPA
ncbi:MAG: NADH-quinone oxidoreductase subunit N [Chloroflexi bacterium]|nr:NADH-quinone oxidoreductase subunit N [Chloroflexota bacterium]